MWLIYLRFEDQGIVNTYHVVTSNKKGVDEIFAMAEQHGLTITSRLVEYAFFYTRGTVKPKHVPNFHFYNHRDFTAKWEEV